MAGEIPPDFTLQHAQYGHGSEVGILQIPTVWTHKPETDQEKAVRIMKEKLALMTAAEKLQELMMATNTIRETRDMAKYRVQRRRKNKAAAKSRARNR